MKKSGHQGHACLRHTTGDTVRLAPNNMKEWNVRQVGLLPSLLPFICLHVSGFLLGADLGSGARSSSVRAGSGRSDQHRSSSTTSTQSSRESPALCGTALPQTKVEITPEMVRKTAVLAQIQITDEEVEALVPRMEEFIGFVETMGEDNAGDSTFASLNCGSDFLREDAAEVFSNIAAVMENMPVEERNYLRVPKVGEDES